MSHAIFRVQGIKTTNDLRGIAKHNVERISTSNMDIDVTKSGDNIQLIEADAENNSYLKKFFRTVEPMKVQHEEKMKTERKDRVKSFEGKINSTKNDVACEFLFASDEKFFEGKSKDDIREWANASLDFVKKEVGISEENILHAVVHMDETTPHLHVVAVPLVKKFDGRVKKDVWQINRKHFMPTKEDMSKLQDKYFEAMRAKGYEVERGSAASDTDRKHLSVERFKKETLAKEVQALETDRQTLQEDVQGLKQAADWSKKVDDVEYTPGGVLARNTVKMSLEDFQDLKAKAKASEGLKIENTRLHLDKGLIGMQIAELKKEIGGLKMKNENLEAENQILKTENTRLELENRNQKKTIDYLKKMLEIIKEHSEKYLGVPKTKMIEYVATIRASTLIQTFKNTSPEKLLTTVPEDEKNFAQNAVAQNQVKKEVVKQELDMER